MLKRYSPAAIFPIPALQCTLLQCNVDVTEHSVQDCDTASQSTGSCKNQATGGQKATRKRGIAAVLEDSTNLVCDGYRRSQRQARNELQALKTTYAPRGNPSKGARSRMQSKEAVKQSLPPTTLIELMASDPSSIRSGTDHLIAYIQRNTSYEVQKAWAISVMGTAMSTWANGIMEAAKYAAECTGFSVETIRRWATSFFLTEYWAEPDSTTDDVLTEELASEHGHSPTYLSSLIHNEEFKFAARTYMCMHACRKGEPNVTLATFAKWVQENYGVTIKEEVA